MMGLFFSPQVYTIFELIGVHEAKLVERPVLWNYILEARPACQPTRPPVHPPASPKPAPSRPARPASGGRGASCRPLQHAPPQWPHTMPPYAAPTWRPCAGAPTTHRFLGIAVCDPSLCANAVPAAPNRSHAGPTAQVKEAYQDNPYHSFRHAVDVMHTTYRFMALTVRAPCRSPLQRPLKSAPARCSALRGAPLRIPPPAPCAPAASLAGPLLQLPMEIPIVLPM